MNRMKKIYISVLLILLVCISGAGCGDSSQKKEEASTKKEVSAKKEKTEKNAEEVDKNTISPGVKAIIETFATCPNEKLYNDAMFAPIGPGTEDITDEDREKAAQEYEKAMGRWEGAIGEYFGPRGLEAFINTDAFRYFVRSRAEDTEVKTKPVKMELVEKDDTLEKVRVTVSVNEIEEVILMTFSREKDGSIYKIMVTGE